MFEMQHEPREDTVEQSTGTTEGKENAVRMPNASKRPIRQTGELF